MIISPKKSTIYVVFVSEWSVGQMEKEVDSAHFEGVFGVSGTMRPTNISDGVKPP